jgi:hypothetical protein
MDAQRRLTDVMQGVSVAVGVAPGAVVTALNTAQQQVLEILVEHRQALVRTATDSILSELPAYAGSGDEQLALEIAEQVSAHIGAFVQCARSGQAPGAEELPFIGETVDRRIGQGIPAEQILAAYRVAHRVLWEIVEEASERIGADEGVMASLALPMMHYIEAAWSEVARGYIRAERRLAADLDRGQSRLVEAMIDGRSAPEGVRLQAGSFPIDARQTYLVLVLHGFPDHAAASLRTAARRLGDSTHVRASVVHVREDDLIAVVALEREQPAACSAALVAEMRAAASKLGCAPALGVGMPACGAEQVREAYREAVAAAIAAGDGGTLALAQMTIVDRLTVMLSSGAVPARLIGARVRAFIDEDLHKQGQLVATLREYAACDLNARRAAESLFVHRNTVLYRLQRVAELTGLDPHLLPQLLDLITAARLVQGVGQQGVATPN